MGGLVGGNMIKNTPNGLNGQLRNYLIIFLLSLVTHLISLIWVLIFVNEKKKDLQNNDESTSISIEMTNRNNDFKFENDGFCHNLKYLFDFNNVKEEWKCCTKSRPNYGRAQIWLILLTYMIYLITSNGTMGVLFQFCEKVK